ncbi:MAG: C-GCAxxG-C-C family protein [Eubacterium sp.]|nr:C-GCAxxG-C-C family protein [Eubacterium sp.]
MNKHLEKAKELREGAVHYNCAQSVLLSFADDLGMSEKDLIGIGSNFGGGMKCGGTCGAIAAGLMVLGALGVESPQEVGKFRRTIADNHEGCTDCKDLLRINAQKGGDREEHCDRMICEAIELVDKLVCSK